jgi:hypothetical protein
MDWYVYAYAPIDFGWRHLKTVGETIKFISVVSDPINEEFESREDRQNEARVFSDNWEYAKRIASKNFWEGDFREDPRVFWLPGECGFEYAFVWKQDNNGTTFIVSPIPLTWLEQDSLNYPP